MRIREIRLKNVKCYSDEIITFNEGVNFISGVNGAGKTTLIESIGYALFNSKPGSIGEFLRYGQKTGSITIEFEANDNRVYRVVRKFGNVNSWLVFDTETDSEMDLHGAVDIVPFLKEVMGIEPDQDPAQLFDDVIGISQGTFTAPFLESAAGRKDKFNRIFKVDSYRTAFHKILSVIRRIEDKMKVLEIEKAEKEGSTREYDDIRRKAEELAPLISSLEKQAVQKKALKVNAENEHNRLRDIGRQIEKTSKDIHVGEERIKGLETTMERLRTDYGNAAAGAEWVKRSQDGYTAYISLKKEQDAAEKQRKERDLLKDSLSKSEAALSKSKAEIETEDKAICNEKTEIEAARTALEGHLETAQKENGKCRIELDRMMGIRERKAGMRVSLEELEKKWNEAVRSNEKLQLKLQQWSLLRGHIENIGRLIESEAGLKAKLSELETLEQEKRAVESEIAARKQTLKTLEENLTKTASGQCPFLDAPCRNVEEGLDAYFSKRIAEQSKLAEDLELKANALSQSILAGQSIKKDILALENEKEKLKGLERQEADYTAEFRNEFQHFLSSSMSMLAARTLSDSEILEKETSKSGKGMAAQSVFGTLNEISASLLNASEIFSTAFIASRQIDFDKAAELLDYSKNRAEKAEGFLKTGKELYKCYDSIIEAAYQASHSSAVKSEQDISNLRRQLEDLKNRSDKLAFRLLKLEEAGGRLKALALKKAETEERLGAYNGLDKKIEEILESLGTNLEAYNTYIKYQTEAAKLSAISADITRCQEKLSFEIQALDHLKTVLNGLEKEYSPEMLLKAEQLVGQYTAELVLAEADLSERRREWDELKRKLEAMDQIRKEIRKLNEQLAHYGNIKQTTVFIRNILNKAGERISSEYRKYLAGEANKIYREVSGENVSVEWRDDYEVFLVDVLNGRKRERCFRQLSGGEQMTAALAMRLGLLKQLSATGVGFFDEPTTNLDGERRNNLAQIIPQVTGNFDQLFIISHDDSFDSMTENIVQLRKDTGEGTKLA